MQWLLCEILLVEVWTVCWQELNVKMFLSKNIHTLFLLWRCVHLAYRILQKAHITLKCILNKNTLNSCRAILVRKHESSQPYRYWPSWNWPAQQQHSGLSWLATPLTWLHPFHWNVSWNVEITVWKHVITKGRNPEYRYSSVCLFIFLW
jgi:hypothetical protein